MKFKFKLPKNLENYYAFIFLVILLASASVLIYFQLTNPALK